MKAKEIEIIIHGFYFFDERKQCYAEMPLLVLTEKKNTIKYNFAEPGCTIGIELWLRSTFVLQINIQLCRGTEGFPPKM